MFLLSCTLLSSRLMQKPFRRERVLRRGRERERDVVDRGGQCRVSFSSSCQKLFTAVSHSAAPDCRIVASLLYSSSAGVEPQRRPEPLAGRYARKVHRSVVHFKFITFFSNQCDFSAREHVVAYVC